jgi:phosphate transport system substrate-binding protein
MFPSPRLLVLASLFACCTCLRAQNPLDRDLAGNPYRAQTPVAGDLKVVGSRTMATLLYEWGEGVRKHHPKLKVDLNCEGTETALTGMELGKTTISAMMRAPTPEEIKKIQEKTGLEILALPVCRYELVLVANKDNPLEKIPLSLARACFFAAGTKSSPPTWGDMGATGEAAKGPVVLFGRDGQSGTHPALRNLLEAKPGQTEQTIKETSSFREMLEGLSKDKNGLGYCSRRIASTPEAVKQVKILKLVGENGAEVNGEPQGMYVVIGREKGKPPAPEVLEFVAFALSKTGQNLVLTDNFRTLDLSEVHAGLDKLGFSPLK